MKYKKKEILKSVSTYLVDNDTTLVFDSGSKLRERKLYLNGKEIGLEGISDYFYFKDIILFNRWGSDDSFYYDIKKDEIHLLFEKEGVISLKGDYIVFEDTTDIFHYKDKNFKEIFSSKHFLKILEKDYGITYSKTTLSKITFSDEILWQFPLSSLGGTQYEPDETDKVNKILGIVHGNLWIYTNFGRLVALNIDTGEVVKKISGNPSDKSPEYEKTFGLGRCYFRESDNNIVSVNPSYFQVIDTKKCSIVERYNTVEADPEAMEAYEHIFHPLLQGDYFTFLGEKKGDYHGIGWVGLYDYKARKLVWEYEVIPQEERNDTRNRLVPPSPMRMSGNKLYVKDIKDNLYIFEREE